MKKVKQALVESEFLAHWKAGLRLAHLEKHGDGCFKMVGPDSIVRVLSGAELRSEAPLRATRKIFCHAARIQATPLLRTATP